MSSRTEQPLFFDCGGRRLYGVWYPAVQEPRGRTGIVLCPALGHEADTSLRVLVDFARTAANAGFEVFRFDYRGCGESEGEFEETTFEEWLEDLRGAAAFFTRQANLQAVGLLGLRLGGTLALLAAPRIPSLEWLCLWEPVLFPREFVDHALQLQLLSYNLRAARPLKDRQQLLAIEEGVVELLGYVWRQETLNALQQLDILAALRAVRMPSLIVQIGPGTTASKMAHLTQTMGQHHGLELVQVHEEIFWQAASRPNVDQHRWYRRDRLITETLQWISSRVLTVSHA